MARAWLAVGASSLRVSMHNIDWTEDEDDVLLENAGRISLISIARRLNRSYGSVRARLNRTHGKKARDVQCYYSARQLAAKYSAPLSRVFRLIETGVLPAKKRLGRWQVDLRDAEKIRAVLSAPKTHSYQGSPPDVGDYERRYGIRRRRTEDGRIERYEAIA